MKLTRYIVTYIPTGRHTDRREVIFYNGDRLNNGDSIHNIMDVITGFEELAITWGSYENKNAITNINVTEIGR